MGSVARDAVLRTLLEAAGVLCRPLTDSERAEAESQWRAVYGRAFRGCPRLRHGSRAEFEFAQQPAGRWLVVPIGAKVPGTSVAPHGAVPTGYECEGPLVPLGAACDVEFAVAPADLAWTMLYTHEDYAIGGPYFVRREWLPEDLTW
jgi:hypothetical protein